VNPPTSAEFVIHLASLLFNMTTSSELVNSIDDVIDMAMFFTELALWDSYFLDHKASSLALASLLNAIDLFHSTEQIINSTSLTAFKLIIESSDLIPCQETLFHLRSRLHQVYSRSEHSQEIEGYVPEHRRISPTSILE